MKTSTDSLEGDRIVIVAAARGAFLDGERLSGRSPATLRARTNALRHFEKYWGGGRDLREVATGDLERYAMEGMRGLGRETAYQYLSTVRALFKFLVERQTLLVDPTTLLPKPHLRERPVGRVLGVGEMARVIESPDTEKPEGLRDRVLLEFLYSTGLRASEARRIRVEEVDREAVTVRGGKGNRDRRVPIGAGAWEWVARYLKEARPILARPETQELWVTGRGNAFGEAWFGRHLRELGRAAGVEGVTCHSIRRSMATHLLSAGAGPAQVSGILGHVDLRSLSRYVKAAAVEVRKTHQETHPREQS